MLAQYKCISRRRKKEEIPVKWIRRKKRNETHRKSTRNNNTLKGKTIYVNVQHGLFMIRIPNVNFLNCINFRVILRLHVFWVMLKAPTSIFYDTLSQERILKEFLIQSRVYICVFTRAFETNVTKDRRKLYDLKQEMEIQK